MDPKSQTAGWILGVAILSYVLSPSSIGQSKRKPSCYTTGLINTGNDCYANSTFQALASLEHLDTWSTRLPNEIITDSENGKVELTQILMWSLALKSKLDELRAESAYPKTCSIWPLLRVMEDKFHCRLSRQQQDAHEMLVFVLDLLESEMKATEKFADSLESKPTRTSDEHECEKNLDEKDLDESTKDVRTTKETNIINFNHERLAFPFTVGITDTIKCSRCGYATENRHETLVLERQPSESILGKQTETIEGYTCSGCRQVVQIVKSSRITKLPKILAVHINRSTTFGGESFRNNGNTDIPSRLGAFVSKSVVFHKGVHSRGHYTCARHKHASAIIGKKTRPWWLISDDYVIEASNSDIRNQTKEAYLLFFELDEKAVLSTASAFISQQVKLHPEIKPDNSK